MKNSYEEIFERKSLNFMKNPDLWPMWPYLPLKNKKLGNKLGILCDSRPKVYSIVYLMNLFELPDKLPINAEKIEYNSLDELVSNGWEVD